MVAKEQNDATEFKISSTISFAKQYNIYINHLKNCLISDSLNRWKMIFSESTLIERYVPFNQRVSLRFKGVP